MKIYTVTFDTATLSPARIWVAPYSQFAVGVKVFVNGTEAEGAVTLKKDGAAIPAEESKTGGFTVFQTHSGATGSAEYEISVEGLSQKMKLVQVTTDSTVFDVGGSVSGGGDMSDYYTKEQTDALLSAKADEADLTAYATTDSLTAYATTESLTAYATTDSLTAYAETGDLTAFYEKSETSSATEIGTALAGKQPTGNYLTAETDPEFKSWLSGEQVGIGYHTQAGSRAIAIGYATRANGQYSVAIGAPNCNAGADGAIQLGQGSNNVANTFKVFSYPMLSTDGKIPNERLHLSAVSESDWATLSGSADAGTFYFVY